ncbi:COMM domain-containing protein 6 isoform X2 [Sarcophilus harrisii]|uniref:COMM domain-containing protein 6 isoform X2 n=1 Tax=Sarcophilus harrisii TaxID=9305 RepID=UPI001301CA86|nr:COMM domain-containing protein 6 isoform X2 [Sarcophilus harrisii]
MAADCQSLLELTMEGLCQPPQEVGSELLDLQWKMGMAVSSDSCKSLKSPYVAVTLKVADQSGQITNKSFEMTIPQFQYFFKQFKEMAAVIETV